VNEAEFQAYYIVSSADPDVLFGRLANLPSAVLAAPQMQIALRVVAAIQVRIHLCNFVRNHIYTYIYLYIYNYIYADANCTTGRRRHPGVNLFI